MQLYELHLSLKHELTLIIMFKKYLVVLLTVIGFTNIYGQLTVTSGVQTPQQYVENVLIGPGVTVSNVQFNNNQLYFGNQIGQFNYTGTQIPFSSGLILASGGVAGAIGPNNSGSSTIAVTAPALTNDAQLNAIAGFSTFDVGKLEFNFVPAGNTVSFNFLFGSEEYNEYVCGSVNDVFGFFVTGPNPAGGNYTNTNLALVPSTIGTTNIPISINTVNNGTVGTNGSVGNCSGLDPNWAANSVYFAGAPGANFQADGMTQMINIQFDVVCGQTYQFKFAVADGGDSAFDSWVFLQSGSFTSDAVNVAVATVSGDTTIVEGCTDANFIFTRPETQMSDTLIINYSIAGDAQMGLDYNNLINPVTFLPGEDTVIVNLSPIQDGLNEGFESVIISVIIVNQCGDTLISSGTIYIGDGPILNITENDPMAFCVDDSVLMTATASGGYPPYTYSWSNGGTGTSSYGQVPFNGQQDFYVTATDNCGFTQTDTVTITMNQTLAIDTLMMGPATCEPVGWVSGMITGQTGVPSYQWTGPGPNNPSFIDASVWQNLSSGWYYFSATDNVCEVNDSIFVDILNPPIAQFSITPEGGCSPVTVNMTNTSQNALNYAWDFGNGQFANTATTASQSQVYTNSTTIRLIASQGNCADTAYQSVTIFICGCMDPSATNYNPSANFDDGSCIYPVPIVEAPNVFTPNGDGSNDEYFIKTENAINVELVILNRWGNVLYEGSGLNPIWNGKSQSGALVDEGVYFYKYKVYGYNDQEVEGHGFLHLVRD